MSLETETTTETSGTSRRALLKGAVAVGVGAAVYASPVVSTVPAYATHGLSSWRTTSGDLCLWFSPNQVSLGGKWHNEAANTDSGATGSGNGDATLTSTYTVGGITRTVRVTNTPDNSLLNVNGTSGLNGNNGASNATTFSNDGGDPYEFYGGGVAIQLLNPTCEFVVQRLLCNAQGSSTCDTTNDNAQPAPWSVGSSLSVIDQAGAPNGNVGAGRFQGDATRSVYYHTGRTGFNGSNRCKFQIVFRIRCA